MRVAFEKVLDALLDESRDFPRLYLYEFSDLEAASLNSLLKIWPRLAPTRKRLLLDELANLAEEDTLVAFDDLGRALLKDDDAQVRAGAMRLLRICECDDPKITPSLLVILQHDEDAGARAEAAALLGDFINLGELGEIPAYVLHEIEDALLETAGGEDEGAVRRRVMESLGWSSRPEVPLLIESAFARQDPDWVVSALLAMGRSSDERWQEQVLGAILSENRGIRLAAVQAAGDLSLAAARPLLLRMLAEEDDEEVFAAIVWSLSQIGGEDVRASLESLLAETEDEEWAAYLEDALDNLAFTEDLERFDLMAFDADDKEE